MRILSRTEQHKCNVIITIVFHHAIRRWRWNRRRGRLWSCGTQNLLRVFRTRWHKVNVAKASRTKSSSKPFTTFGHPNCALKIVDATGPKTALMSILTDEFAKRFSSTTVSTSDGFRRVVVRLDSSLPSLMIPLNFGSSSSTMS